MVPRAAHRAGLAFRLTGSKWLSMYLSPFVLAALGARPGVSWRYVAWGSAVVVLWNAQLTLWNRLADEAIDAVNEPSRVVALGQVGRVALRRAALAMMALLAMLMAGASWWRLVSPGVLAGWVSFVATSLSYNLGPRFKTRTWAAVLSMSAAVAWLFGLGTVQHSALAFSRWFDAVLLFVFSAAVLATGAKDVTDTAGDRLDGFDAAYHYLSRGGGRLAMAVGLTPYVLLSGAAVVSWALDWGRGEIALGLLVLCPFSIVAVALINSAGEAAARAGAREWALGVYIAGICLIAGQGGTAWLPALVVALLFYPVADRYLSVDVDSVRWENFEAAWKSLRQAR